jgi:hypothetical protein
MELISVESFESEKKRFQPDVEKLKLIRAAASERKKKLGK